MGEDIPRTGCEEGKEILGLNSMEKELQILKESPKVEIHLDSVKKYQTEKLQTLKLYTDSGLKIHFHARQTAYRNK